MDFELFADSNNLTDLMMLMSDFKIVPDAEDYEEACRIDRFSTSTPAMESACVGATECPSPTFSVDSGVFSERSSAHGEHEDKKFVEDQEPLVPSWMQSLMEEDIKNRKTAQFQELFELIDGDKKITPDFFEPQPVYYFPPPVSVIPPEPQFYQHPLMPLFIEPSPVFQEPSEQLSYPLCIYCQGKCTKPSSHSL